MRPAVEQPSSPSRWGTLCPAGCLTNHGGPRAAKYLGEDWLAIPAERRPTWTAYLAYHGRRDRADQPAPEPTTQEA